MAQPDPSSELAAAVRRLEQWQNEAARLQRDRQNLRYLLIAAPAALACLLTTAWLWGAALLAAAAAAFVMGMYMTAVRRQEHDEKIADAKAQVAAWQAACNEQR